MSKYAVLIIDDDESTHEVLGEFLRLAGYNVYKALDGSAGLEMMKELRPDLVILDVNMPVMDGFETMETITKDKRICSIPVLFLTSFGRADMKRKGLGLGADDYIEKPFNRAELLDRIEAVLKRSERYRHGEKSMEGDLADMSLAELMQTFDMSRKTAQIRLMEIEGLIYVEKGDIVYASFRRFAGRDALLRILFLERGTFAISFDPLPEGILRKSMPIQNTLLNALTYIDELKVITASISPENVLIEIGQPEAADISRYRELSPVGLYDLITFMEGDLKENALLVSKEIGNGRLSVVRTEGSPVPDTGSSGTGYSATPPHAEESPKERFIRLFELGFDKYREGDHVEALAAWEAAYAVNPEDKVLNTNLEILRKKLKAGRR